MPRLHNRTNSGCIPIIILLILIPLSLTIAFQSIWSAIAVTIACTMIGWAVYYKHKINAELNAQLMDRLLKSGIREIDVMTGIQFEHYLKLLFEKLGYSVNITKASGDFGADLVISMHDRRIVIQAKRYFGNIGIKAVQEVQGSRQYYGANEAWVVTNSYFTEAAKQLATVNGVVLIDRQRLIELILSTENS